jgi:large subunit ribosomal protein L29
MLRIAALPPSRAAFSSGSLRPARPQRVSIITHVKPTKLVDFKDLSDDEIMTKVVDIRKQLFDMRMRAPSAMAQSTSEDKVATPKAHEYKHLKRQIAQLLTLKRQRQIELGVGVRTSRALDKKEKVLAGFGQF